MAALAIRCAASAVLASRKEGRQRYIWLCCSSDRRRLFVYCLGENLGQSDFGYLILLPLPFYQFGFVALVVAVTGFTALFAAGYAGRRPLK